MENPHKPHLDLSLLKVVMLTAGLSLAPGVSFAQSAASAAPLPKPAFPEYTVNGGDTLHITVWKEQNLDKDVTVQPDGKISFPLVGDLQAVGKTTNEIRHDIAESLRNSDYFPDLKDPEVDVAVVKATGNAISVVGQVKLPGTFHVEGPVDVMQAISLAGGLTPFAGKRHILILRREDGKQVGIPFNYSDIEDGEQLDKNIVLRSGDVVVVPD
jgi:polysaccharide export outer membrane protein